MGMWQKVPQAKERDTTFHSDLRCYLNSSPKPPSPSEEKQSTCVTQPSRQDRP